MTPSVQNQMTYLLRDEKARRRKYISLGSRYVVTSQLPEHVDPDSIFNTIHVVFLRDGYFLRFRVPPWHFKGFI